MKKDQKDLTVTAENLEKATNALGAISDMNKPDEVKEEISKGDGVDVDVLKAGSAAKELLNNPTEVLLEDETFQKASEPVLALAAFQAEHAEHLNKAVSTLEAKIDGLVSLFVSTGQSQNAAIGEIVKSFGVQTEMLKSVMDQPAGSFKTTDQPTEEVLAKATEAAAAQQAEKRGVPAAFIEGWMEKAVKNNKLDVRAVSLYELNGTLPDNVKAEIVTDWRAAN